MVLDNQLVCFFSGKPIFPTLSISLLPVVFYVGSRPPGISPCSVHFCMVIVAVLGQLIFKQLY